MWQSRLHLMQQLRILCKDSCSTPEISTMISSGPKVPKKSLFHLSMTLDITHLAPKSQELAGGFGEPFARDDFDLASPCFACDLEGFDLDIVGNSLS